MSEHTASDRKFGLHVIKKEVLIEAARRAVGTTPGAPWTADNTWFTIMQVVITPVNPGSDWQEIDLSGIVGPAAQEWAFLNIGLVNAAGAGDAWNGTDKWNRVGPDCHR
jgi:hypothetical protein